MGVAREPAEGFLCPRCGRQAVWVGDWRMLRDGSLEFYRKPLAVMLDRPAEPEDEPVRKVTQTVGFEARVATTWRHLVTLECPGFTCGWMGTARTAARGRPMGGASGVQTAMPLTGAEAAALAQLDGAEGGARAWPAPDNN